MACPGGRLGELVHAAGARVLPWHAQRQPGTELASEIASLRRIVRATQPGVVHLHCAKAGLAGRSLLRGTVPTVFSPHAWSFLAADGMMQRAIREWERFAARWTAVTVCVSHAEAATGRRHGIRGRIAVLPNEITDHAPLDALASRYRGEVRTELGISAGTPIAVIAARLTRQKGQDVAIDAWRWVREQIPTAELVLVGDGPDRIELAEAAGSGVRFIGAASRWDTLRWMTAADVVLCPSRWEGMSLVPLEALTIGRAVIASDVDGMAEVLPAGSGWLVPVDDTRALAEQVVSVLAEPAMAFDAGQRGRAAQLAVRAEKRPSSAERLVALYRELAAVAR